MALRAAHVAAAQDPEGLTTIGVIRHFPADIRISARESDEFEPPGSELFRLQIGGSGGHSAAGQGGNSPGHGGWGG